MVFEKSDETEDGYGMGRRMEEHPLGQIIVLYEIRSISL
jgi:hypothetical protein